MVHSTSPIPLVITPHGDFEEQATQRLDDALGLLSVQTTVLSKNSQTVYQSKSFSFPNLALGGSPRLKFHQEFNAGFPFNPF